VLGDLANFVFYVPAAFVRGNPVFFTLLFIWILVIWSVFGGAIARIAAVHVARDEKLSVRQALRFSMSKLLSFLFAPVIPLAIVLCLGLTLAVGGLLLYIPAIGPFIVGLLFFVALAIGLVMTLLVLGTVGGFNLMYPTVAVEGSDSFDAISRSFSYVYARPWRMLWYTLVSVAYGALTYLFVRLFLFLMLGAAHYFVAWFLADSPRRWDAMWPGPANFWDFTYTFNFSNLSGGRGVGAALLSFWIYIAISLLGAFAISFYFSANTVIYYLMRQEVDATEMDDVYLEQSEEEFAEPAGAAAAATNGSAPAASDGSAVSAMTTAPPGTAPAVAPETLADPAPAPQAQDKPST
jgi:hypothetical protein